MPFITSSSDQFSIIQENENTNARRRGRSEREKWEKRHSSSESGVHGIYEVKPCHCESKKRWTAVTRGMEINPVSRAIGIWSMDRSPRASLPLFYFPFPLTTYRHLFEDDKFSDIRWNTLINHLIGIQYICWLYGISKTHIIEYYLMYFFLCVEYKKKLKKLLTKENIKNW